MTKHENIVKALKARLSELTTRVGEIDSELRKPLSADLEEQATDLENQEALEAIENSQQGGAAHTLRARMDPADGVARAGRARPAWCLSQGHA